MGDSLSYLDNLLPEYHFSESKTSPSKSDGLYSKLTEKLWQQIET